MTNEEIFKKMAENKKIKKSLNDLERLSKKYKITITFGASEPLIPDNKEKKEDI